MAKDANQSGTFSFDPTMLGELGMPVSQKDGRKEMISLGKKLEESGLVDDEMLKAAMARLHTESAASLKHALVEMNFVTEEDILDAVASEVGMKRVKLSEVKFTEALLDSIPIETAKKYRVVPVRDEDFDIWVALSDPSDVRVTDDLQRILGKNVHPMFATDEEIDKAIRRYYEEDAYTDMYEDLTDADDGSASEEDYAKAMAAQAEVSGDDSPLVVQFVDLMFKQSVLMRASDIHLEPQRQGLLIRIRVDGVLQELPSPPPHWRNAIIARLKVMASLDIAEKRIPLDGRIKLNIPGRKLDLRVSTLPTIYGESIVMRILDQASVQMGLEDVGFLPDTIDKFNQLIRSPNGILLMTGPTGSGKTTTLYAALGTLNTPEHKIMTLEDPIEYMIPGINQVQIHADIGLTFPIGLRGLLRQSPDVILVGEIRDLETAENAIRAALTGHLVFSTLHTNDAPSATIRLIDMGVKPYLVASSVQAVIAQRLVRRICANCKRPYQIPDEEILSMSFDPDEYRDHQFFKGTGCERCGHGGYRGRTAVHEVFTLDSELRRRVIRCEASTRLKRYAMTQGMRTLRMDGWEKILMGQTTVEAVHSVVGGED